MESSGLMTATILAQEATAVRRTGFRSLSGSDPSLQYGAWVRPRAVGLWAALGRWAALFLFYLLSINFLILFGPRL
ncbi:hypothetical protein RchiOBHm_Chr2g0114341 [Rosa chinensis]|uniref:Uncharacterized protein n=1 Tax=Rosa chinensis TaxID=74649 RepID=A0A2P6RQP8_ROSCH|nr:hypothetical protein RchiOBHm_Chr2g0114341 [Rosa chinensis]